MAAFFEWGVLKLLISYNRLLSALCLLFALPGLLACYRTPSYQKCVSGAVAQNKVDACAAAAARESENQRLKAVAKLEKLYSPLGKINLVRQQEVAFIAYRRAYLRSALPFSKMGRSYYGSRFESLYFDFDYCVTMAHVGLLNDEIEEASPK
jgi:hypothetical protein